MRITSVYGHDLFASRPAARPGSHRAHRRIRRPPIRCAALVDRLDLEKYKATVKGLTQFGDRRQGTDRNRAAVDWIEAQLKSYGCPTERVKYVYDPPPAAGGRTRPRATPASRSAADGRAATGCRPASTPIR